MHVAIAGNIGAGKTSLTQMLAQHYKWEAHFEHAENNPYLHDFYDDMQRWSFHLQIYYLNARFTQIQKIKQQHIHVIQDRTIYEDAYIFAPNLHDMNLMTHRDFENYSALFNIMEPFIAPPDMLIYLRASTDTLTEHIKKRGRNYEESLSADYISLLNQRYETWISSYNKGKLLIVNIDENRFTENKTDFQQIITEINAQINL